MRSEINHQILPMFSESMFWLLCYLQDPCSSVYIPCPYFDSIVEALGHHLFSFEPAQQNLDKLRRRAQKILAPR